MFREFCILGVPLIPAEGLVPAALDFSFLYKHPVYDCIYVALAITEQWALLTADTKLFRTFSKSALRMIRLLKDWQS